MLTLYMIFWSAFMISALGVWRLRTWGKILTVIVVTAVVLLISNGLFQELCDSVHLEPLQALLTPDQFLRAGLAGWFALLVLPFGWFGPVLGMNLIHRYETPAH